jgi:hypothetical protein
MLTSCILVQPLVYSLVQGGMADLIADTAPAQVVKAAPSAHPRRAFEHEPRTDECRLCADTRFSLGDIT